jgi:hypothetical protein
VILHKHRLIELILVKVTIELLDQLFTSKSAGTTSSLSLWERVGVRENIDHQNAIKFISPSPHQAKKLDILQFLPIKNEYPLILTPHPKTIFQRNVKSLASTSAFDAFSLSEGSKAAPLTLHAGTLYITSPP